MYDTTLGRFLERDPIEFHAGDGNLYAYAGNSPQLWTDPRGLQTAWKIWKGAKTPSGVVEVEGDRKSPKQLNIPPTELKGFDGKPCGDVKITGSVGTEVEIVLEFQPKNPNDKNCCGCPGGKFGWIQHVTELGNSWRYDNKSFDKRLGAESDPAKRSQPVEPPKTGPWKQNPWYGGPGNITGLTEEEQAKLKPPVDWAEKPQPQTVIKDRPDPPHSIGFVDQLICVSNGKVLFDYAWLRILEQGKVKFIGGRASYGGNRTGLEILPKE